MNQSHSWDLDDLVSQFFSFEIEEDNRGVDRKSVV